MDHRRRRSCTRWGRSDAAAAATPHSSLLWWGGRWRCGERKTLNALTDNLHGQNRTLWYACCPVTARVSTGSSGVGVTRAAQSLTPPPPPLPPHPDGYAFPAPSLPWLPSPSKVACLTHTRTAFFFRKLPIEIYINTHSSHR